jgi:hypothetical protein
MFSRTFEYKGYDGQMHKETFWFNLSEDELYKLELGNVGGVNGMMNRMLREEQPDKIVDMFERIILMSVGERSADGRRFVKKMRPGMPWGEVAEDFRETPAYSQLFIELVKSGEALANFLKGAIPAEVAAELAKKEAEQKAEAEKAKIVEMPKSDYVPGEEANLTPLVQHPEQSFTGVTGYEGN